MFEFRCLCQRNLYFTPYRYFIHSVQAVVVVIRKSVSKFKFWLVTRPRRWFPQENTENIYFFVLRTSYLHIIYRVYCCINITFKHIPFHIIRTYIPGSTWYRTCTIWLYICIYITRTYIHHHVLRLMQFVVNLRITPELDPACSYTYMMIAHHQ